MAPFVAVTAAVLFVVHVLNGPDDEAAPDGASTAPSVASATRSFAELLPRNEREAQRLWVIEVRALVAQARLGAARDRARDYFERWPNGPDTATLVALTGVQPQRSP